MLQKRALEWFWRFYYPTDRPKTKAKTPAQPKNDINKTPMKKPFVDDVLKVVLEGSQFLIRDVWNIKQLHLKHFFILFFTFKRK